MNELTDLAKVSLMVQYALKHRTITDKLPTHAYLVEAFNQPAELVSRVFVHLALLVPEATLQTIEGGYDAEPQPL